MILPILLLAPCAVPPQADAGPEVSWRGRAVPAAELPAELGEGPAVAALAWSEWCETRGYRMHLDANGRVLLVAAEERGVPGRSLALVEKTVKLFDEVLPAPPREEEADGSEPGGNDPAGKGPGRIPEDPEGPPAGWAPKGLPELPWTREWGDDTVPLDTETCVLFALRDEQDYRALLDELAAKQEYLRAWLPTAKEHLGFALQRPLAGAYVEDAEGMEEWSPEAELVHRAAELLLTRRFSRQPYWLVQGFAWQVEFRLLKGIWCFPYRSEFVFAVEHGAWPNDLRTAFSGRKREPLVIGEFARMPRGEYQPKPSRIAFGLVGHCLDHHRAALPAFVEALRLYREGHERVDDGGGSWHLDVKYEIPLPEQARLLEASFGKDVWAEAGEFFRKGKSYRRQR